MSFRMARCLMMFMFFLVLAGSIGNASFAFDTGPSTGKIISNIVNSPDSYKIYLAKSYGVSLKGFSQALAEAQKHFLSNPNEDVIILIPEGVFDLSAEKGSNIEAKGRAGFSRASINLSQINSPAGSGNLVIAGAGKDKTFIIFNDDADILYGESVYRTYISGVNLSSRSLTTTQGSVVDVGRGYVTVGIQQGFPDPISLMDEDYSSAAAAPFWAYLLRKCTDDRLNPRIVSEDNLQVKWNSARKLDGGAWRIDLLNKNFIPKYKTGDLIAVKAKNRGYLFLFRNGAAVGFYDVAVENTTGGFFLGDFSGIFISDFQVRRHAPINGRTPCLASSQAGPQIGQPLDKGSHSDIFISNFEAIGTGDDSLAFFNHVSNAVVQNSRISGSFAAGIRLFSGDESPDVKIEKSVEFEGDDVIRVKSTDGVLTRQHTRD